MERIIKAAAATLRLKESAVRAVAQMLAKGDTVPFISRYRKEATGNLDETQVRAIELEVARLHQLEERRQVILQSVEDQGKLTPELREKIEAAATLSALEDIYLPFRPKRRTRASIARERGLEPLAKMLMSAKGLANPAHSAQRFVGGEVADANDAIAGAGDIIAEWLSESGRARNFLRGRMQRQATVHASIAKGREDDAAKYLAYDGFSHPLRNIPSHSYLALRRGEAEGVLKVSVKIDDDSAVSDICKWFVPAAAPAPTKAIVADAAADGYKRLLRPSIESEMESFWKENADTTAIRLFSDNLRQLLLASPLRGRRVLAIDPGYRTGCKLAALDESGNLLDDDVIYPNEPQRDTTGAMRGIMALIDDYDINAIALGDRTASRDTEDFLRSSGIADFVDVFIVSENGASVYSASEIAREELPDKDVTVRGAVSIGRRLIDPLAELVKIDPKSIGVGQYQHDVDQKALRDSLDFTVTSCVNLVGVDLNTASAKLLSYIAGIGSAMASKIVDYRTANGPFESRAALLKVPRLGAKTFEQAAGFLRVPLSENPLDNTGIHPESYHIAEQMAADLGVATSALAGNEELIGKIDPVRYAAYGEATVADILAELRKPGRDPRVEASNTAFDASIRSIDDLAIGMVIPGKVTNITAFGAFVDIGIKENGLLHISQMAAKRVHNPADVVRIGQNINVKVIDIDLDRRRISLSLKDLS